MNLITKYFQISNTCIQQHESSRKKNVETWWAYKYLYRKVSFYLTPFFVFLGLSANQSTNLNLLVVLGSYVALFYSPILGASLFLFSIFIDFVDGNLARYYGKSSYFGKFYDGFCDIVSRILYLVIPLAFYQKSINADEFFYYLLMGAITMISIFMMSYAKIRQLYFSVITAAARGETPKDPVLNMQKKNFSRHVKHFIYNIIEFLPALFLVFVILKQEKLFLIFAFIIQVPLYIAETVYTVLQVYRDPNFKIDDTKKAL